MPWIGPFIIHDILNKKTCILSCGNTILKTKQLISNLKKYYKNDTTELENLNKFEDNLQTICPQHSSLLNTTANAKYFNPVSLLWMKSQCKRFNFPMPQISVAKKNKNLKLLSKPKERITIIGDSNCWFRAISLWISDT